MTIRQFSVRRRFLSCWSWWQRYVNWSQWDRIYASFLFRCAFLPSQLLSTCLFYAALITVLPSTNTTHPFTHRNIAQLPLNWILRISFSCIAFIEPLHYSTFVSDRIPHLRWVCTTFFGIYWRPQEEHAQCVLVFSCSSGAQSCFLWKISLCCFPVNIPRLCKRTVTGLKLFKQLLFRSRVEPELNRFRWTRTKAITKKAFGSTLCSTLF